jgi:hypothetical protein
MEEWRDIEGYEGLYQVSSFGNVRSKQNQTYRSLAKDSDGYYYVVLWKNDKKKNKSVSRLVGKAFIQNPENKPVIDHIDRCKTNNTLLNLRWATYSENSLNRIFYNSQGYKGVYKQRNRFSAYIDIDNKHIYIGTFSTAEEASEVREAVWAGLNSLPTVS